jgi:hypothetical protein
MQRWGILFPRRACDAHQEPIGQFVIGKRNVKIIVFDEQKEVIVQWVT